MAPSKLRFQLYDSEGNKFTISLEGNVSRDRVLQILDLFELMGGLSASTLPSGRLEGPSDTTKLERIKGVIRSRFPIGWFSSKDVQTSYEEICQEPITLSTVSTYLQRLSEGGLLLRSGSRAERRYKLARLPQGIGSERSSKATIERA